VLLYLNSEWKEAWGGELELWDATSKTCQVKLLPILLGECISPVPFKTRLSNQIYESSRLFKVLDESSQLELTGPFNS
jgi:hypothetical protein